MLSRQCKPSVALFCHKHQRRSHQLRSVLATVPRRHWPHNTPRVVPYYHLCTHTHTHSEQTDIHRDINTVINTDMSHHHTRRCENITPVLQQLHWLSVSQRVQFKIAMLVYNALPNLLPAYLAEDCQLMSVTGRRRLWSSGIDTCLVQRTNTRHSLLLDFKYGTANPSMPTQLRDIKLGQFPRALKTHLFGY